MRNKLLILFLCLLPLGCVKNHEKGQNAEVRSAADAVAQAAAKDLSLEDAQTKALGEAVYELYMAMDRQNEQAEDPSAKSEMTSQAYKAFQESVSKCFPKEKATEVLAWYYNYSNANQ